MQVFSLFPRDAVAMHLGGASRRRASADNRHDKHGLCRNAGGRSRSRFRGGIWDGLMALLTAVLFNVDLCIGVGPPIKTPPRLAAKDSACYRIAAAPEAS